MVLHSYVAPCRSCIVNNTQGTRRRASKPQHTHTRVFDSTAQVRKNAVIADKSRENAELRALIQRMGSEPRAERQGKCNAVCRLRKLGCVRMHANPHCVCPNGPAVHPCAHCPFFSL